MLYIRKHYSGFNRGNTFTAVLFCYSIVYTVAIVWQHDLKAKVKFFKDIRLYLGPSISDLNTNMENNW